MSSEEPEDKLLLHKKRKLSSFSMDDVSSQALSSTDVDKILGNLDNLNGIEDIEGIQRKLQGDYKLLAKQFGNSRLARVNTFLNSIEKLQFSLRKQFEDYEEFVNNNLPLLEDETGAESVSAAEHKSNKRRRNASQTELTKRAASPPPERPLSPPVEQLPIFTESFDQILKPYAFKLQSLRHNYDYESDLIENWARSNVELVWRQSIKDRMDLKNKIRSEKSRDLIELEKDYYNENRLSKISHLDKKYKVSTKKVGERKHSRYASNEQIRDVDHRVRRFNTYFTADKKPLFPAYDNEIEHDLELMKTKMQAPIRLEKVEANYLYQEQPLKRESFGPTTMTDLVNNEIEERGVAGMNFQLPNDPRLPQQIQTPNPNKQQGKTPKGGDKHIEPHSQHSLAQSNQTIYVGYPNLQQQTQQSPPLSQQQNPSHQQHQQGMPAQSQNLTPQAPQQYIPQQQPQHQSQPQQQQQRQPMFQQHSQGFMQPQFNQQQPSPYSQQVPAYQYQPVPPPVYYNPQVSSLYFAGNLPYSPYPVYAANTPYQQAQQQPQ